ncbi:MAG: hypothetical protein M3134_10235, partial [Actinomycetota bacterium]|nr:hypothetical protein [Actinomycetota bacterium]
MRSTLLAAAAALLLCPASASGWSVPADATGDGGDQHVDYPPFDSRDYGAPYMTGAGVGDVNGDGLEDFAVGFGSDAPNYDDVVYVTFSSRGGAAGDVAGFGGFRIVVPDFTYGIAGVGDVNGDSLDDIAVSEYGRLRVVFGKPDGAEVDTEELGPRGFTVSGVGGSSGAGHNGVYVNR